MFCISGKRYFSLKYWECLTNDWIVMHRKQAVQTLYLFLLPCFRSSAQIYPYLIDLAFFILINFAEFVLTTMKM